MDIQKPRVLTPEEFATAQKEKRLYLPSNVGKSTSAPTYYYVHDDGRKERVTVDWLARVRKA